MRSSSQAMHSAPPSIHRVLVGLSIAVTSFTAPAVPAAEPSRERLVPEYVLLCHAQDAPSSYAARKVRSELERRGVPVRELPLDRLSTALRFEVDPPAFDGRFVSGGAGRDEGPARCGRDRDDRERLRALRLPKDPG